MVLKPVWHADPAQWQCVVGHVSNVLKVSHASNVCGAVSSQSSNFRTVPISSVSGLASCGITVLTSPGLSPCGNRLLSPCQWALGDARRAWYCIEFCSLSLQPRCGFKTTRKDGLGQALPSSCPAVQIVTTNEDISIRKIGSCLPCSGSLQCILSSSFKFGLLVRNAERALHTCTLLF